MEPITKLSDLNLNGSYTYADYLNWRLEQTVELIKGKIFLMSPAPNVKHQRVSAEIFYALKRHLRGQPCLVFSAPFDVRLLDSPKAQKLPKDIYTVVQPDLCLVCDPAKLDEQGCVGPPDLIVEILSKGNSKKDMKDKYRLYEENGVVEYWIVYPYEKVIQQFVLNETGCYALRGSFAEDEIFSSVLFPDLTVDLTEIFAE
jgi:Uma2 family endonuclease